MRGHTNIKSLSGLQFCEWCPSPAPAGEKSRSCLFIHKLTIQSFLFITKACGLLIELGEKRNLFSEAECFSQKTHEMSDNKQASDVIRHFK